MGLFICLPPVLCALFTFSFFFPCSVTCFLQLPYFFCDFVWRPHTGIYYFFSDFSISDEWMWSYHLVNLLYFFLSIFLCLSSWYFYFLESYINFILQDATKVFFFFFFLYSLPYFLHLCSQYGYLFFFTDWKTDRNEIHFLKAGTLCTSCEMMLLFGKVQNEHAISIILNTT